MSVTTTDTITTSDYITIISLGISVIAIVLVIYFQSRLKSSSPAKKQSEVSEDKAIEVSAIVSEFGSRLRRLEEGLVDLRVKLEILDLRILRGNQLRTDSRSSMAPRPESSYGPSVAEPVPRNHVIHVDNSEI